MGVQADRPPEGENGHAPKARWAGKRKRVVGGMGVTLEAMPDGADEVRPDGPLESHPTIRVVMDPETGAAGFQPEFPMGPGTFADGRSLVDGPATDPIPHGSGKVADGDAAEPEPEAAEPEPEAAATTAAAEPEQAAQPAAEVSPPSSWAAWEAQWEAAHEHARQQAAVTHAEWQAALAHQQRLVQQHEQQRAAWAYEQWQQAQGSAERAAQAYEEHAALAEQRAGGRHPEPAADASQAG